MTIKTESHRPAGRHNDRNKINKSKDSIMINKCKDYSTRNSLSFYTTIVEHLTSKRTNVKSAPLSFSYRYSRNTCYIDLTKQTTSDAATYVYIPNDLVSICGGRTNLFQRVGNRGCRVDSRGFGRGADHAAGRGGGRRRCRRHARRHANLVRRDRNGHILVGVLGTGLVEAEADDLAWRRNRFRMRFRRRLGRVARLGRLRRRALLDR